MRCKGCAVVRAVGTMYLHKEILVTTTTKTYHVRKFDQFYVFNPVSVKVRNFCIHVHSIQNINHYEQIYTHTK